LARRIEDDLGVIRGCGRMGDVFWRFGETMRLFLLSAPFYPRMNWFKVPATFTLNR